MRQIQLTQEQVALVSAEDFEAVNAHKWRACKSKMTNTYYAQRNIRRGGKWTSQLMHQFIAELIGLDLSNGRTVDHENHNTLDNTRGNLRSATRTEQQRNKRKRTDNSSGLIGVTWHKASQKWNAQARVNGRNKSLGLFDDLISAGWVRDNYVKQHHGEFAVLNNPPERRLKERAA
ncbi:hypothetical protein [Lacipirellula sp.]|uniref:hypothetical protein n=1 Tax=Lacipirellula sp. TaxID=2691419 RepID=UPI003D12A94D